MRSVIVKSLILASLILFVLALLAGWITYGISGEVLSKISSASNEKVIIISWAQLLLTYACSLAGLVGSLEFVSKIIK